MELGELNIHIGDGNYSSKYPKNSEFLEEGVPFISASDFQGRVFIADGMKHISEELHSVLLKGHLKPRDILVVVRGNGCGKVGFVPAEYDNANINAQLALLRCDNQTVNSEYLYYLLSTNEYQNKLKALCSGSAQPQLPIKSLKKLQLELPKYEMQLKIAGVAKIIDDKMLNNAAINRNLSEQAFTLFKKMFPSVNQGEHTLGEYLSAVKGKALLSKNAVAGDVPVIAGGLAPATYHNVANTKAPVLTISASGANAGYVALWHVDVWSSDSSYIDSNMTKNVYFWYAMLKTRQKEIFDAQTGSAQPHIYPKNIDVLPVAELDGKVVADYTMQVSPLFEMMGKNNKENERLSALRDSLLPKLMSGELDIADIDI